MLGSAEATLVKKKIISLKIKAKVADFGNLCLVALRTDSVMFPSSNMIEAGMIHHQSTFKNQMNDSSTVIW